MRMTGTERTSSSSALLDEAHNVVVTTRSATATRCKFIFTGSLEQSLTGRYCSLLPCGYGSRSFAELQFARPWRSSPRHEPVGRNPLGSLVGPLGLEPRTYGLKARSSTN